MTSSYFFMGCSSAKNKNNKDRKSETVLTRFTVSIMELGGDRCEDSVEVYRAALPKRKTPLFRPSSVPITCIHHEIITKNT